jgi:ribosome-associated toxin RatA of RatAB toxin-antitoxin module
MKTIEKSVLIWFSAQEMFNLVVDVRSYPAFLPWCDKTEVLEETPDRMTARIAHGSRWLAQKLYHP